MRKTALVLCFVGLVAILALNSTALAINTDDYLLPYDPDANTVVLYHLNNNLDDVLGNHNGSSFGNLAYATGKFGEAVDFDGAGDYLSCGNVHKNPNRSSAQGTVEMWVNFTSQFSNEYHALASLGRNYGGQYDDGFYLGFHPQYSNSIVFGIWNGQWNWADSGLLSSDVAGGWHHLAGTWGSKGIELWVDGELKGTNSTTAGLINPDYSSLLLGTDSWSWDTAVKMDEVRISDVQRVPVPEPSTILLLLSACAFIPLYRHRVK